MSEIINEAYAAYDLPGDLLELSPLGNGLINRTYQIRQQLADGTVKRYVLQQINHHIFPDVPGLMNNIVLVTEFLKNRVVQAGGDPDRQVLTVVKTRHYQSYTQTSDGTFWRVYPFVEGTYVLDKVEHADQFYETGRAFGAFTASLDEFDASQLVEVIPMFHDTRNRYAQFEAALIEDRAGRANELAAEIQFIQDRKDDCYLLYDLLDAGKLPLRVTHNDTKLNNILIDEASHQGICIVDLDTIMPGLALFDFGDAIRYGANDAAEDESDMTKVHFDFDLFKVYTQGFLAGAGAILTENEKAMLPWGARVIALEQGIRFLTDYLNGDVYYATSRAGQNLDRTRTQLKLVQDMEAQWGEIEAFMAQFV